MKKCTAALLAALLLVSLLVPAAAATSIQKEESLSPVAKELGSAENVLLEYNRTNNWFDELYSDEFASFALDFMLGDKYESIFPSTDEYCSVRTYFANYLFLIQGRTETEMAQIRAQIHEDGIFAAVSSAKTADLLVQQETFALANTSTLTYNESAAISYAWQNAENTTGIPYYENANCVNFVSQCLHSGGLSYTRPAAVQTGAIYDTSYYWYCDVAGSTVSISTSHIRTGPFLTYWNAGDDNGKVGRIYLTTKSQAYSYARSGDVILLTDLDGTPYHTIIITGRDTEWQDLLFCAHTNHRLDASFNETVSTFDNFILLSFSDL